MKCPGCQQDNPSHANFCLACGVPLSRTSESGSPRAPYRALQRALSAALEQQTATSENLRVISSSPTDVQPVFDVIGERAEKLCDAEISIVSLVDGEMIQLAALHGVSEKAVDVVRRIFPMPRDAETLMARAVRRGAVVHVPDVLADAEYGYKDTARTTGQRGCLAVPMVREGQVIGAIFVARRQPGLFSKGQVELLKTFADQAVIAIENVRLFTELQEKNKALTTAHAQVSESLEQQTATSEILRVISSSPTDVQPVFEAIAQSAMRLCDGTMSVVSRYDGELIHLGAYTHVSAEGVELIHRRFPMQPMRDTISGRVVLEGRVVHIPDVRADAEFNQAISQALQSRSSLGVPMLLDGKVVGAITVARHEVRPFSDAQIELLKTFADQAVIASENVRLFKELEVRNRDLTEALEQQTATGDILQVIAGSPTEVQPVLDAVTRNAARLCEADDAVLMSLEGERMRPVAHHGPIPLAMVLELPLGPGTLYGRSMLERRAVQVADAQAEVEGFPESAALARQFGTRAALSVPLLREGEAIGAIVIRRREVRPFSDKQIALLKTFADQAVIAIENVRLFTELQEKNGALASALEPP